MQSRTEDIAVDSGIDSSFKTFFLRFGTDSVFQKSSIKFPVPYHDYVEYADSTSVDLIQEPDWNYINFADDSLARNQTEDAYEISFESNASDQVEYVRTGIDNGINIRYIFIKKDDQWFLEKIIDQSN